MSETTDRRWSEATRDLVAQALYEITQRVQRGDVPIPWVELDADIAAEIRDEAGQLLDAMSADGLLADPQELERLRWEREHAKADRQDMWDTRDKRNHSWMEAAERYQTERDEARARVAELEAELERWRAAEVKRLSSQLADARRNRPQVEPSSGPERDTTPPETAGGEQA